MRIQAPCLIETVMRRALGPVCKAANAKQDGSAFVTKLVSDTSPQMLTVSLNLYISFVTRVREKSKKHFPRYHRRSSARSSLPASPPEVHSRLRQLDCKLCPYPLHRFKNTGSPAMGCRATSSLPTFNIFSAPLLLSDRTHIR